MVYPYAVNIRDIVRYEQISDLCTAVSEERQARIAQYHYDKDKIRCLAAELLLRYALAKQFGMDHNTAVFQYTENGKPLLKDCDVHFNLSHSGDWIVCAVGKVNIGIDVEEMRETAYKDIYCSFAQSEIDWLNSMEPDARADGFYQVWTLKESYVKYCGIGLMRPLSDFSVDVHPDGSVNLNRALSGFSNVRFYSRKLDEMHWYALCSETGSHTAALRIVPQSILFNITS